MEGTNRVLRRQCTAEIGIDRRTHSLKSTRIPPGICGHRPSTTMERVWLYVTCEWCDSVSTASESLIPVPKWLYCVCVYVCCSFFFRQWLNEFILQSPMCAIWWYERRRYCRLCSSRSKFFVLNVVYTLDLRKKAYCSRTTAEKSVVNAILTGGVVARIVLIESQLFPNYF